MSTKKWLLGVFGGALLAGAAAAQAGVNVDLRLVSVDGAAPTDAKSGLVKPGSVATIEIWAQVTGADATRNEGITSIAGSLVSTKLKGAGAGVGTFVPKSATWKEAEDPDGNPTYVPVDGVYSIGQYPFQDNGTVPGTAQILKGYGPDDLSVDLGGEPTSVVGGGDFLAIRAASMVTAVATADPRVKPGSQANLPKTGQTGPVGREYRLGQFEWVVGTAGNGGDETGINFFWKATPNGLFADAVLYRADGQDLDAATGSVSVGAPIVLTAVPEPAGLSVLALGALGLLARRRK